MRRRRSHQRQPCRVDKKPCKSNGFSTDVPQPSKHSQQQTGLRPSASRSSGHNLDFPRYFCCVLFPVKVVGAWSFLLEVSAIHSSIARSTFFLSTMTRPSRGAVHTVCKSSFFAPNRRASFCDHFWAFRCSCLNEGNLVHGYFP